MRNTEMKGVDQGGPTVKQLGQKAKEKKNCSRNYNTDYIYIYVPAVE